MDMKYYIMYEIFYDCIKKKNGFLQANKLHCASTCKIIAVGLVLIKLRCVRINLRMKIKLQLYNVKQIALANEKFSVLRR